MYPGRLAWDHKGFFQLLGSTSRTHLPHQPEPAALTWRGVVGRGRAGKVQLVLEVFLVLRLPLQADLLPEAGRLTPATHNTAAGQGMPTGTGGSGGLATGASA